MTVLRVLFVCAACLFAAVIVWAAVEASIAESFSRIVADPWGMVALLDLYLGFVVASVVIAGCEGRRSVVWIAALFVLGNVVTALWLARRLPDLIRVLRTLRPVS